MKPNSFAALLWQAFLDVNGWLLGLIGAFLSIATLALKPGWVVPLWLLALILVLWVLSVATLLRAGVSAWGMAAKRLPEVRQVVSPPDSYQGVERLLLLAPSELFATGMMVSVYVDASGYERFCGIGQVMTIQENKLIQVGLLSGHNPDPELLEQLARGEATFLRSVVVRPNVPSFIL